MNASTANRASSVRHYLDAFGVNTDPATLYRFSVLLASWEGLRLLIDAGRGTVADDHRLTALHHMLEPLSQEMGLGTELTDKRGFLRRDPQRLICSDWRHAAAGW
jgi:hypothetical protein